MSNGIQILEVGHNLVAVEVNRNVLNAWKPLLLVVGVAGFEPTTS